MDSGITQILVTALATFLAASSGFWIYLKRRLEQNDSANKLLLGLAHFRIVELGMEHIANGFVSKDEYDDLIVYFYEPYVSLGGNGSVERIMRLVQRLPLTLPEGDMRIVTKVARVRAQEPNKPIERADELEFRKRQAENLDDEKRRLEDRHGS